MIGNLDQIRHYMRWKERKKNVFGGVYLFYFILFYGTDRAQLRYNRNYVSINLIPQKIDKLCNSIS